MSTTPTGSDNPFNTGTTDNVREESDGTYEYDYDYGGSLDDPNNPPVEQLEESLNISVEEMGYAGLAVVLLVVAVAIGET